MSPNEVMEKLTERLNAMPERAPRSRTMMFVVRFVNGCGDHVSVLVDVAQEEQAESLAREAIAADSAREVPIFSEGTMPLYTRTLNCSELESIRPFEPTLTNHRGTALLVDEFDHEDPSSFDGLL